MFPFVTDASIDSLPSFIFHLRPKELLNVLKSDRLCFSTSGVESQDVVGAARI